MAPSNPPFPLSGKKSFALTQKISNSQSPRYLEFRGFGLVPVIFPRVQYCCTVRILDHRVLGCTCILTKKIEA